METQVRTYTASMISLRLELEVFYNESQRHPFFAYADFGTRATGLSTSFDSAEVADVARAAHRLLTFAERHGAVPPRTAETHLRDLTNLLRAAALAVS